ncbi:hypothetical protein ASPSYDRAFT_711744 [Aspergillus sydowii CBS 593.65]|uniref:Uncharacterized protein n=1 Tax=Aspergillus sydowii CBS 593.65 TaxID=1036612 RepID=A0A1L9SXU0_9EURO|nr:uncharacterized protein ASPSYDRAFT_165358 [Aspergillus sydowii CBS 593.65]XP_040696089.1 uncharacterized protein ASPSYDRAFT_711744 [Aspergillus sydowii CBS 593.65]OJJ52024.1 hypothetical protein ASPSYDRAFT_165358 [Aspergillus sydowii CBS 593.65]OJJ52283.1 hypothetical protein ASPSYDRAFT_711744 [Aspergillus sydowii CBS 593.65]
MAPRRNSWDRGLFHCFNSGSTCLSATFVPCCLFNRIGTRFRNQEVKSCGEDCCVYSGGCCLGISCVPLCFRRRAVRKQLGLDGNCCGDIMASLCCSCCVLTQLDHETRRTAATSPDEYQSPAKMVYTGNQTGNHSIEARG